MIATHNISMKNSKIKFPSKCTEDEPRKRSREFGDQLFENDKCNSNISVTENKNRMKKSQKFLLDPSDGTKLFYADNVKVKSAAPSSRKRLCPLVEDNQRNKRQKMDCVVTQQCSTILKMLMTHPAGWVFNKPVDPVKLGIPDYFSIISKPMDLGTIKAKLEKHGYFSVDEFAADVRLTFANAMHYNPASNAVHLMAKELDKFFSTRWKCLEVKWIRESTKSGLTSAGRVKDTSHPRSNCQKKSPLRICLLPKKLMSAEEKQKLRKELLEVSRRKVPQHLRSFLQKFGLNCKKEEKIEVDVDMLDDETLWELKRVIKSSLSSRAAKVEPAKVTESGGCQSLGKVVLGVKWQPGVSALSSERSLAQEGCDGCKKVHLNGCKKVHLKWQPGVAALSSERSLAQEGRDGCKKDHDTKNTSTSQMGKSDPGSDGAVNSLDEENAYSCLQLSTVGSTAACEEGSNLVIDVQLSPKKALRAAMLKSRFADTILKARQKTLDQDDKADPVKLQQEKERLERLQLEEKARIEAQIRATEEASRMRAEAERISQREREREAARLALDKMEKTVESYDDSWLIQKDLEKLSGCSLSECLRHTEKRSRLVLGALKGGHFRNPLERLGLYLKDDYLEDEDGDEDALLNRNWEDGEILS